MNNFRPFKVMLLLLTVTLKVGHPQVLVDILFMMALKEQLLAYSIAFSEAIPKSITDDDQAEHGNRNDENGTESVSTTTESYIYARVVIEDTRVALLAKAEDSNTSILLLQVDHLHCFTPRTTDYLHHLVFPSS